MPNYSILTIPAFALIPTGAHFYAMRILMRAEKSTGSKLYYNNEPRAARHWEHILRSLSSDDGGRWARARAAHTNGLETFPLFAASIICANYAGLHENFLNTVGAIGIAVRLLFTVVYINTKSEKWSWLRTAVFGIGNMVAAYTLVKAGLQVSRK